MEVVWLCSWSWRDSSPDSTLTNGLTLGRKIHSISVMSSQKMKHDPEYNFIFSCVTSLSSCCRYNLLFFLSGGGKFNYQGTKRWLEDNLDHTGENVCTLCYSIIGKQSMMERNNKLQVVLFLLDHSNLAIITLLLNDTQYILPAYSSV